MNEIEVAKLPKGIEGLLSELKPATVTKWNVQAGKYEIDNSMEVLEKQKGRLNIVKDSLRVVYEFGETVSRGTPKFCLALFKIFENLYYIEDSSAADVKLYGTKIEYKPSFGYNGKNEGFSKLIGMLGLSSTSAYRYKDLAHFVNEETGEYYSEFQGYSISLLSEMWAYALEDYSTMLSDLKSLTKIIPATTTIDDMRQYRKVIKLLNGYKGVFKDYKFADKENLKKKPLSKVLKLYNELVQKEEMKKLEATMSGVEQTVKEDKSVKVLPAADEITVKKDEYEKLCANAQRAAYLGHCSGCKHKETNLNKCRCCRRYESLKDLFEAN